MQSTLRSRIATAALLLAPVAALVAAQPASAAPAVVAHTVVSVDTHHDRFEHRDNRAPAIYNVTPSQGDRVSDRGLTQISARFSDDRSGIDTRSVTLRVDGRNVTGRARVDGNDIRYADNLRPGRHSAELLVRDRAGNVSRHAWSFAVVDRDSGRYGHNG